MTRRFPLFGIAMVVALAAVVGVFAFRPASADAAIGGTEAPREIDAHQYVGFHLTGLPASGVITETFYGPGGTKFSRMSGGQPIRGLIATAGGTLDVAISPYYDLRSVAPGNWWVQYC